MMCLCTVHLEDQREGRWEGERERERGEEGEGRRERREEREREERGERERGGGGRTKREERGERAAYVPRPKINGKQSAKSEGTDLD